MSTAEARRSLADRNQALRQENIRLKDKKDQIAEHLSTILKRCKQMQALKRSLTSDLEVALDKAKIQRNKKSAYIGFLQSDIKRLQEQLIIESTQFKKLQSEYEICLQDYDNVLKLVTEQIEKCKIVEADIILEKENNSSMKAMIFDYERLKRVLQQQRKYFKELSSSEEKSHEQRVSELEKILKKLGAQQKISQKNVLLSKYRSGLNIVHHLFKKKRKNYAQFLRDQLTFQRKAQLGIRIFKNCLELANLKHKQTARKLFYQWHHNVFPKQNLQNLVQLATLNNIESFQKLKILNKMIETTCDRNLAVFHLYQKGKYLSVIANKIARKDMHYGFNKWRSTYHRQTEILNRLSCVLLKMVPHSQKKFAFKAWKTQASIQKRLLLANRLLNQYLNTKQLSRMFRKWRLFVSNHELKAVQDIIFNIKLRNQITSRINYEKRKTKALTTLAFRLQRIKLRNYFTKYWVNVQDLTIEKSRKAIEDSKNKFSELRSEQKLVTAKAQSKAKKTSLKIFRVFMMNSRLRPAMKKWRNTMIFLRKRSQAVRMLCLKKQSKTKSYIMNEFRKCVQYFEKKEMHQVLTDLNNKMQAINEKSTNFRERLKKCIEDLGVMASKKVDYLFNYSVMCQERVYFTTYIRQRIKKLYRQYILYRFGSILNLFGSKKGFNELAINSKDRLKEQKLQAAQKVFLKSQDKRIQQKAFFALKGMLKSNKTSFKLMGQSENIIMFYRMASAFVALQRKNCAQKIKGIDKKIASNEAVLKTKEQNITNLEDQKKKLQQSLRKIFVKFVGFEDRNMILKQKSNTQKLMRRYFSAYRENVQEKIYAEKVLLHFSEFVAQKNRMIFWKGASAIKFENTIAIVKQQLAKINKKKKAFEEKREKGKGDIQKRLEESEKVHSQKFQYYDYYLKKFENTLKFYEARHFKKQNNYYMRAIFNEWRRQYKGAKGLANGINRVWQRNLVHPGYQQIAKFVKKIESQEKSQQMCIQILQRKARNCMKDCIMLWRCNLRKLKAQKLEFQANKMIETREQVADDCKQKVRLVADERIRMKRKKLKAACFMAMKTEVTQKLYQQRYKIKPFNQKKNQILLRLAIKSFKWLMFYKKTKRAYLKYKKQKFESELKRDVFLSLKIYRQQHYTFVSKTQGAYDNIKQQYMRFALDKILNLGAYQRDKLNYERRRALRHIVMNKVTKVYLIKRKLMAKWRAWLIPREHYLPNILKNLEVSAMRRYFANIKQHAYWNPIYIKKAADTITSEGYSQINATTNNLVKQGFDPQQIKQYLTTHNDKDTKNIKLIVSRIKTWGSKQDLVRAWNSWKQYLALKIKIRRSLSKVINIAQGLGRYWNRWRSKDPQFNAILEKQSRGNMLQRYRDLGRLLKQYKRDVKQSTIYCKQLKQVNDDYADKNDEGIKMALSTLSNNLKKAMKQGLQIWRTRLRQHKKQIVDDRFDQLSQGISILVQQRNKLKYRLIAMQQENKHMKQKCNLGKQCGQILQKLLRQRDSLSIDLADKQHNMKLLLQDNLRLKQKIRSAKQNAEKLINKVQNYDG